jgi:cytochrome oxidase Cu insertion factor (SCO1/SenC/PrrC family)
MQTHAEDSLTPKQIKANRIKLFVLFFIPFAILTAAYLMFYSGIGIPSGTTNKGELLQPPVALEEVGFTDIANDAAPYPLNNGFWHIVLPVAEPCAEYCQQRLYITRQVHLRLGKKGDDLARVVIMTSPPSPDFSMFMAEHHPYTKVLLVSDDDFARSFDALNVSEGDYFLSDPRAWMMMGYREVHQGEDLLDDLKKLLR